MDLVFAAKEEFNTRWKEFCMGPKASGGKLRSKINTEVARWRDADPEKRQKFVARFVDSLETIDQGKRVGALEVLSYIVQGRFVRGDGWWGLHCKNIGGRTLMTSFPRCFWRSHF